MKLNKEFRDIHSTRDNSFVVYKENFVAFPKSYEFQDYEKALKKYIELGGKETDVKIEFYPSESNYIFLGISQTAIVHGDFPDMHPRIKTKIIKGKRL